MPPSEIDLTTAALVAADLRITADDALQRRVTSVSRAIANYLGRELHQVTNITEYPAGYGRPLLTLERTPVVSISSISVFGAEVDPSDYECVGPNVGAGLVFRRNGWWPSTARDTGRITPSAETPEGQTGTLGITAVYTGGWVTPGQNALDGTKTVTLPDDIQEAAILSVTAAWRRRGVDPNVASKSIGDWSVSYRGDGSAAARGAPVPDEAIPLLAPYRRLLVG